MLKELFCSISGRLNLYGVYWNTEQLDPSLKDYRGDRLNINYFQPSRHTGYLLSRYPEV